MTMPAPAEVAADALGRVDRWSRAHGWAADVLVALAAAAVLGSLTVSSLRSVQLPSGWTVPLVAAFAVLHLSVAARRRAPAVAYSLAGLAMLVVVAAPDGHVTDPSPGGPADVPVLFLPSSLVFLLVLYAAAARLPALLSRLSLLIAVTGALLATVRITVSLRPLYPGSWVFGGYVGLALTVTVLATWSLGRIALVRRQRAAAERAETTRLAVLEERARIARDMHDIVAHSLAVIVRQAEGGAFVAGRSPEKAETALRTIADTGRGALTDMRGLLGVLRDPAGGPPAAEARHSLADLSRLVARVRDTGLDVVLTERGTPFAVGPAAELAAYRLVQEGLTNAVKYAGPRARVRVGLHWRPADLAVDVSDDGGADGRQATAGAHAPVPGAGAGLQGLRERVAAVGGTLDTARLEPGFRVEASFPRPTAGGAR